MTGDYANAISIKRQNNWLALKLGIEIKEKKEKDGKIDRRKERQTDIHTYRETDRQTDRQTIGQ